jgi:hypothetical protein
MLHHPIVFDDAVVGHLHHIVSQLTRLKSGSGSVALIGACLTDSAA